MPGKAAKPRAGRLKVYRTAIGFHDAYVAAPSQKAALEAWGSGSNLFAIGAAEVVTDPELTAEPLAFPGTVVKRARGSVGEHLAAAAKDRPRSRPSPEEKSQRPKPARAQTKLKPRPSRAEVAEAEEAIAALRSQAEAETAELDRREAELRKEREALEGRQARAIERLQKALQKASERYEGALERWRAEG